MVEVGRGWEEDGEWRKVEGVEEFVAGWRGGGDDVVYCCCCSHALVRYI